MTLRMIIYVYFLTAFNLTITTCIPAQTPLPRNYIPPSPTAANLGLYAAIPVNYYTGVPDISIPLSAVKIKQVDLNINLSYHSNAIRQADEASWVGWGWSLNAGGVITRTKRHKDDFSARGFYKINSASRPCNDDYDQEPDLFFFNFAGKTGKFYIESVVNGQPVIRSLIRDMLKIRSSTTGGWEITDENGTLFQFEAKESITENYKSPRKTETETFVSSWYLTRITNAFNESISFSYTATGNKIYKKTNYTSYKELTSYTPAYLFAAYVMFGNRTGIQQYAELSGVRVTELSTSETYTDEVLLSKISFPTGSLQFETGDRSDLYLQNRFAYGRLLRAIHIKRMAPAGEELFKTYTLSYGYFYSNGNQPAYISTRLQLTGVAESSANTALPPYRLFYNTANIPNKENTLNFGGFLTDINAGLLNKMMYPTGGFTLFTFEPNTGNTGARIKKIEHKDPDASVGMRIYEYAGGKQLSNARPINGAVITSSIEGTLYSGQNPTTVYGNLVYKTYMSSDQCLMGESSGDYIVGYDKVTEYLGERGQYGKSEYSFINEASPITFGVPAEVSNLNGSLTTKEEFANKNGTFLPTKKMAREVVLQPMQKIAVKRRFQEACNNTYSLKTDWIKLLSETEYNYDNGTNPVVLSKSYLYENAAHIFPTTTETVDSKERSWQTKYKYTIEKASEEGGVYTRMVSRNILAPVMEETRWKEKLLLSVTKTTYREWDQAIIAPETEMFQKGNYPAEVRVRFYKYDAQGNPLEVSKEHDLHTAYMWDYGSTYPVAQVTNAAAGSVVYAGFETGDAKNNQQIQMHGITSADAFTGRRSFNLSDPLLGSAGGLQFSVDPVDRPHTVSCWAKGGAPVLQYIIGSGGNTIALGTVHQHGAAVNGWSYYEVEIKDLRSVNISGTGLIDEVRIYPKGAWMNTYSYTPLIGMTEECDKNNQVTRYSYDALGRLRLIKDREYNTLKTFEYHIGN